MSSPHWSLSLPPEDETDDTVALSDHLDGRYPPTRNTFLGILTHCYVTKK